MMPSQSNPVVAAKSLMATKAKNYLHLFTEGALSFFAFLLSIFIYVSVLNLSLSNDLLNDTKFWFCISNTLIFIIAADCGAFSPPPPHFHGGGDRRSNKAAAEIPNQQNPEDNLKIIVRETPNSGKPTEHEEEIPHTTDVSIPVKFNPKKSYQRSKLEKVKRVAEKERMITMRRSKTMIRQEAPTTKEEEEKNNEFAEMTDEELNRRVEEFIERFNRQIRLQEIGHGDEQ